MLSYLVPELFTVAAVVLVFTVLSVIVDFYLLYRQKKGVEAKRISGDRLSNGDENKGKYLSRHDRSSSVHKWSE